MTRRRRPRNPQDELVAAELAATVWPSRRNRARLHRARQAYAIRVAPSLTKAVDL